MPWSAKTFKQRHSHSLTGAQARRASRQANAILRSGASEKVAIATANKAVNKSRAERWYGKKDDDDGQ